MTSLSESVLVGGMRKLFCLFGLFAISLFASAAGEWLYYKHYPWVYDNVSKDWLYLRGSPDGEVYAYRSSTNAWEVFEAPEPTWEEKYEEWILNPEPYGGLNVLQLIKDKKESGDTEIDLKSSTITELSPLEGLTNLTTLRLNSNNITDLTPLAGLANLTELHLYDNSISDLSPLAELTNLRTLSLWDNSISDISPLAGMTNLTSLELGGSKITDLTPLAGLTNLTNLTLSYIGNSDISLLARLTNLTRVSVPWNNISDISPLAGLTNLKKLYLSNNNISDISPLSDLLNLVDLNLQNNQITASQKAMLEEALPNTSFLWPDEIIDDIPWEEKAWEQKYQVWILNPEPYGGLEVLQKIKDAKDSGATEFVDHPHAVYGIGISDISPFEGLNRFERLSLGINNISDLTPLSSLTNLRFLNLEENNISDLSPLVNLTQLVQLFLDDQDTPISLSQKAMLEEALPNTDIIW